MGEKTKITLHTEKTVLTPKNLDDPVKIVYPQVILGIHADKNAVAGYKKFFNKEWYYNDNCHLKKCQEDDHFTYQTSGIIDGHIWITVTRNGELKTYSLWKDGYTNRDHSITVDDNGPGYDIHENIDKFNQISNQGDTGIGIIHRYYLLSPDQESFLHDILNQNITYSFPSYQCATWAADVVESVTGESYIPKTGYYPDRILGIVTPRMVASMIYYYENNEPTSGTIDGAKRYTKQKKY